MHCMLLMCGEQIFVTDYAFTNKTFYKHDPVFVFNSLIFHSFPGYPYIQMLGCLKIVRSLTLPSNRNFLKCTRG